MVVRISKDIDPDWPKLSASGSAAVSLSFLPVNLLVCVKLSLQFNGLCKTKYIIADISKFQYLFESAKYQDELAAGLVTISFNTFEQYWQIYKMWYIQLVYKLALHFELLTNGFPVASINF